MKYLIVLALLALSACAGAGPLPESAIDGNSSHVRWNSNPPETISQ